MLTDYFLGALNATRRLRSSHLGIMMLKKFGSSPSNAAPERRHNITPWGEEVNGRAFIPGRGMEQLILSFLA